MSGENANIATAGSSRPRPRTNSALANGAENQFTNEVNHEQTTSKEETRKTTVADV